MSTFTYSDILVDTVVLDSSVDDVPSIDGYNVDFVDFDIEIDYSDVKL